MKLEVFADLGLVVMNSCEKLGKLVDDKIRELRKGSEFETEASFIIEKDEIRFSNGEGKVFLQESVRGKDVYVMTDIGNYSISYNLYGRKNFKSPDDHLQDVKRAISAMQGKARRITLVMPLLYASRQHKRKGRESLDCAIALQELERLGVDDILTFDAHDPTIQNAVPLISFESFYPTNEILKQLKSDVDEDTAENMLIISPDTGAMDRAVYYSSVLSKDIGLFYKRRDHSKVVNGKNPIVAHVYIGKDVENSNILIVDDMIASGETMLDIAYDLKKRKAGNIYVTATFALFTEGIEKFQKAFDEGVITRVYTTNLTYIPEEARKSEWLCEVDMSDYLGRVINLLNFDRSISDLIDIKVEKTVK